MGKKKQEKKKKQKKAEKRAVKNNAARQNPEYREFAIQTYQGGITDVESILVEAGDEIKQALSKLKEIRKNNKSLLKEKTIDGLAIHRSTEEMYLTDVAARLSTKALKLNRLASMFEFLVQAHEAEVFDDAVPEEINYSHVTQN